MSTTVAEELAGEDRQRFIDYIQKRMINGIKNHNAFDLLEAESVIERVGVFEPGEELRQLVLNFLNSNLYHRDFDMLRLSGYLKDEKICSILEKRYEDLTEIWKEQDVIRLAESYRTMLFNVTRRANEMSTIKIAADPYLNTLDTFFDKSFSERNLDRFPQLVELRNKLFALRQDGILSKDNILTVIDKTRTSIDILIEKKEKELKEKYMEGLPKPNRLIALHYCLLESLLMQKSARIKVDDEFIDKISQDFRAAVGSGTKRFVLNTLLKFRHPSFAEIASEARYGIQHRIIEKVERKERGELEWKSAKIDLNEMQVFELYRVATDVIARNPNPEVYETLLYTYTVPALLMGLRALEKSDMPPADKLGYLQRFFSLGTVNDYVFIRAVEVLAQIKMPAAKMEMAKIIASRYGWRKVNIPKLAFNLISDGFDKVVSSADLLAVGEGLVNDEQMEAYGRGEEIHYPYEHKVYESTLEKIVLRFEKNPFHGINEIALQEFYKRMLAFITGSAVSFATRIKRRLLEMIRRPQQMSIARVKYMKSELQIAADKLTKRHEVLEERDRSAYSQLVAEMRKAITAYATFENGYEGEEKRVREIPVKLSRFIKTRHMGELEDRDFIPLLEQVYENGASKMKVRQKNLDASARKRGFRDEQLYPIRYQVSSNAILRVANPIKMYASFSLNKKAKEVLDCMGMLHELRMPPLKKELPTEDKLDELWSDFKASISKDSLPAEEYSRALIIGLLTAGTAEQKNVSRINKIAELLYAQEKPAAFRLAFLGSLPVSAHFGHAWLHALSREKENVLFAVRDYLGEQQSKKLQTLVPELCDIFY